jgi:hypothetical protein
MGTVWSNNTARTTQCFVTSFVGSLAHAPMAIVTHDYTTDTVIGWGRMRIRMPDSSLVSDYVPVLQVHDKSTEVDSFFINGVPVHDSILYYLGLEQGKTETYYRTEFLRPGEIEAIQITGFTFPNHTLPTGASAMLMHLTRLSTVGVSKIEARMLSVYPNPAKSRTVRISWPGAPDNAIRYTLTNFAGSKVAEGNTRLSETIILPQSLNAGFYSLSIMYGNNVEAVPLMLE